MPKFSRKKTTEWLSKMVMRDLFHVPGDKRFYWASEVTFANKLYEPGKTPEIRVDFVSFKPVNQTPGGIDSGEFTCYEVKSCMADFKSDHGHNLIGDRNYYVMPESLYRKLLEEDPHLKQLTPQLRGRAKPGIYIPQPGYEVDDGLFEKGYAELAPELCLRNPTTGLRDTSTLKCVRSADRNLNRMYSNTEMLFALMRSAGRDRVQYQPEFWK